MKKKHYVWCVFDGDDIKKHNFLKKIQDYHEETGSPIYFSFHLNKPLNNPEEKRFLQNMTSNIGENNLGLVKQFLSQRTYDKAKETHLKSKYYKYKIQSMFIENAIEQIRGYDPFYFTMDDIHDADAFQTVLVYKKSYYNEKMLY